MCNAQLCCPFQQGQVLQAYSERASKARSEITPEDVLLAIQSREAFSFVQPPPQDVGALLAPESLIALAVSLTSSSSRSSKYLQAEALLCH